MPELNGEAHHIKVLNLPAHAAIKIHGFKSPEYDLADDAVLLFDRLEGMNAFCVVEGTKNEISIDAGTPIVELGNDEYEVEEISEATTEEDKSY